MSLTFEIGGMILQAWTLMDLNLPPQPQVFPLFNFPLCFPTLHWMSQFKWNYSWKSLFLFSIWASVFIYDTLCKLVWEISAFPMCFFFNSMLTSYWNMLSASHCFVLCKNWFLSIKRLHSLTCNRTFTFLSHYKT